MASLATFNRTLLELKSECAGFQDHCTQSFNRTLLELKYVALGEDLGEDAILQSHLTGIEILLDDCTGDEVGFLQSHLTGIEIFFKRSNGVPFDSFNRTLLELKLTFTTRDRNRIFSFNRTLLELKYYSLIVPSTSEYLLQSHLTGIEIFQVFFGTFQNVPFNRTLLELKLELIVLGSSSAGTFNRTLLELKSYQAPPAVSIKPNLQSHLTGIEIPDSG